MRLLVHLNLTNEAQVLGDEVYPGTIIMKYFKCV